ncbi:hypothetical protein Leryth_008026, partial [Lithospermum erythrorhizon]
MEIGGQKLQRWFLEELTMLSKIDSLHCVRKEQRRTTMDFLQLSRRPGLTYHPLQD